jgi:hypothetical protein
MPNTPNKIKDPTEAALSAIQGALSARDAAAEAQASPPAPQVSAAAELQWLGTSSAPNADVGQSAEEISSRTAANNDPPSIGDLLRALQRRPAGISYLTATLFAGLWLLAGLVVAWIYWPAMWLALGPTAIAAPLLTIVFFVPIIFFYVVAHMRWRSQELRLITQSIAQVAMRLAEPETVARESIVTIGQAIRREVAALGDGVERALARATELETRMGNELSALEHAYSETEVRIRGLLQDLSTQRDSLVGQAGQIRDAVNSVHRDLNHDISQISEQVAEQVNEASRRMTHTLSDKAEHITQALGKAGDAMTGKSDEITVSLDQQFIRFRDVLDSRAQALGEVFSARMTDVAERMTGGSKEAIDALDKRIAHVIGALDKRIGDLTDVINARGTQLAENIGAKIEEVDRSLGVKAMDVTDNLDARIISRFERLLTLTSEIEARSQSSAELIATRTDSFTKEIETRSQSAAELLAARTESLTKEIEARSQSAADLLSACTEHLSGTIRNNAGDAGHAIETLTTASVEAIGARAEQLTTSIKAAIGEAERALGSLSTSASGIINACIRELGEAVKSNSTEAERSLTQLAANTTSAIRSSAHDAERVISGVSTGVSNVLKQNAGEVERSLLSVSAEVARNFAGKSEEISTAVHQRAAEMTQIVDEKSSGLLAALTRKGEEFMSEVSRVTADAVRAIEATGFNFTQTMMENSKQIARLISEASETAAGAVNQSLQDLQTNHIAATDTTSETVNRAIEELRKTAELASQSAAEVIGRTLKELQDTTHGAVEQSKQTASAALSEMQETHNMVRADTTALYERLREANILLQEVLSGAHENMTGIESTLVARAADFVAAMNNVAQKAGAANSDVERNIAGFKEMSTTTLNDLSQIAGQFNAHACSLAEAVASLEGSNRQSERALAERRSSLEHLMRTLDSKAGELEERLTRFAGVLDQSLGAAGEQARELIRLTAESATSSAQAIRENFDAIRSGTEEERARLSDAMHSIYEQASEESHSMLSQAAQRFAEVLDELKQMSVDMRRELEGTRAELRKGILELPQETADAASRMRRVIVDQIEALAELNRIVARHGRSLEAVEPPAVRMEPAEIGVRPALPREEEPRTNGNARGEPVRARSDMTGMAEPVMPPRRDEAPSLARGQAAVPSGRTGWLSELLTRASHDSKPPARGAPAVPPLRGAPTEAARPERPSIESLDSLAVEIARMIDHHAAAELWDRYKRGERNVFTRKLYTMQGQKAFEEIHKRYRGEGDFKRTVDRYIGDFERLLEEVSREDRGQMLARSYLMSETGKVYTMLAHAAGRFD